MKAVKMVAKLLLMPFAVALLLIQWVLVFLNGFSETVIDIVSLIFILVGVASLIFGLATGAEAIRTLIIAFVLFLIPQFGNWMIKQIVRLRCFVGGFIGL